MKNNVNFNRLTILLLIIWMAAVVSSCLKEDPTERGDALQISVTAVGFTFGNPETRAINTGYATTLSTGDRIGITVVRDGTTILENNIPYVYSGSAWDPVTSACVHFFPDTNISYFAYYPYSTSMDGKLIADIIADFNPKTDQSNQNDYDASDLMTGMGVLSGATLTFKLTHALSLIELNFPAGTSSVVFDIEGGTSLKPYSFNGLFRYIAKSQSRPVKLTGSCTVGSEKKNWQSPDVTLTAGEICRINVFPPFFIEGYTGDIQVFYTDNSYEITTITGDGILKLMNSTGKTVRKIVLLDKGKEHLIGRTTEAPIRLKFDANGNLLFRNAMDGYIPIGSYAEFQKINESATARAGNYRQEANLDLMNEAWTPVGNNTNRFMGVFDGNHKTISRLRINSGDYVGLFGAIGDGGTVQNIVITNGIVNGRDYTGGITGYLTGNSIVEFCENNAAINGRDRVGGIAGCVFTPDGDFSTCNIINACKNTGTVTGTGTMTGGIVGQIRNNNVVKNCYSTGNISGENNVGGVAGIVYYTGSRVEYCYAMGTVSGTTSIGGVAGQTSFGGAVGNCVALNPVVQATATNIGRIVGYFGGNLTYNLAWDGMSNGSGIPFPLTYQHNNANGKSITLAQSMMQTTYVDYVDTDLPNPIGWDFINTWRINEGNGYPVLQWE